MNAGSLGLLHEPVDEPLESYSQGGDLPALDVRETQTTFADRPVQYGHAAERIVTVATDVHVSGTSIDVDRFEQPAPVHTEWIADVTEAGIVVAESTVADFPFGLFAYQLDTRVDPAIVDVLSLAADWQDDGKLTDVWMTGSEANGTSIDYHDAASPDDEPTIGLGFERAWQGTVAEGVVYRSGYLAVYNDWTRSRFVQFLEDEVLDYAEIPEDDLDGQQATLGETESDLAGEVAARLDGGGV